MKFKKSFLGVKVHFGKKYQSSYLPFFSLQKKKGKTPETGKNFLKREFRFAVQRGS